MPEEIETINPDVLKSAFDGAFKHKPDGTVDPHATEQAQSVEIKTEEKPAEAVKEVAAQEPTLDDIPTEFKGRDWAKNLNKAHREAVSKLKELQGQLTDFEGTRKERDELQTKIEELRQQNAEYKKGQSATALEMDPDFRKKYVDGRNTQVNTLKTLSDNSDIDFNALQSAMAKTGKERFRALDDVISDAPRSLQTKLLNAIDSLDSLESARAEELSNADAAFSQRQSARQEAERAQSEQRTKVALDAWNEAQKIATDLGLDSTAVQEAEAFFKSNKDVKKAAEAVVKAKATDVLQAKVKELQAELEKIHQTSPGVRSGNTTGNDPGSAKLSFSESVLAQLHRR